MGNVPGLSDARNSGRRLDAAARAPLRTVQGSSPPELATQLAIGRMNDNELVFFREEARESWIIYPPRSRYEHVRRPTADSTVVEHHPWAPLSETYDHVVRPAEGCAEHGVECGAYGAIKAATQAGWDPFR